MQDANLNSDLFRLLQDYERRIHNLETAARLPNSSQTGGLMRLLSPTTGLDIRVDGVFNDGVTSFYGQVTYDGQHHSVFMVRDDKPGLIKPDLHLPFHTPNATVVTSGSFAPVQECAARAIYHDAIFVEMAVVTDPGVTGEIKITEGFTGATTATLTVPASTTAGATFAWAHPFGIGDDPPNPIFLQVQARVAAGAGNFFVFPPNFAVMTSSVLVPDSAPNGAPTLG